MKSDQTISAQRRNWSVIKKLGEGDAGEVYLMESLLDHQPAILKRPRKGGFFSDVQRQARQIKTEGTILQGLNRVNFPDQAVQIAVPGLLDQSRDEYGPGEQTFIVIEPAPGFDLMTLRQLIRTGAPEQAIFSVGKENEFFSELWTRLSEFPEPLLVRILIGVIDLLETIHNPVAKNEQVRQLGIIWNDVKVEHLFWDPRQARLSVIDWGNSQFLKEDGSTRDRQFTYQDDFIQFVDEMGKFVSDANPALLEKIGWPPADLDPSLAALRVADLKASLALSWEALAKDLHDLRTQEADMCSLGRPEFEDLVAAAGLWKEFARYGELPDLGSLKNMYSRAALHLASTRRLDEFKLVCEAASRLPDQPNHVSSQQWLALNAAADVAMEDQQTLANALSAGVTGDWAAMLWTLFTWVGDQPLPDWWEHISQAVRQAGLNLDSEALPPLGVASRCANLLQSAASGGRELGPSASVGLAPSPAEEALVAAVREEILKKWVELEPDPPNAGVGYAEIDLLGGEIQALSAPAWEMLEKAVSQPKAQAELVKSAWERKDFDTAQKGLKMVLLWDPDRRRLFTASRAIGLAAQWLGRVRKGAAKDEPFYDFLTSVELSGRTLRNQVGPAKWLDTILEALKRLRKGTRSIDLTLEFPDVQHDIPWLNEYRSREILSLPRSHTLTIERDNAVRTPPRFGAGIQHESFGSGHELALGEALDTWVPEAQGSSARVFAGNYRGAKNRQPVQLAIKLMRPNRVEYALPLFCEEVRLLTMLRDVPGISPLVECGFMQIENATPELPADHSGESAEHLKGKVIRYSAEEALNFLGSIERQSANGWLPYLALVERKPEHNLMRYCDSAYTHGWFLPLKEGLLLAIQICSIIQTAHERNIVYRDHKILHYYWDPDTHGVVMIDWNIAKHQSAGLTDAEKQFDLVQFGARALHHILTGRPAPGSLPLGPNRADEIEQAAQRYAANWTYDDERLPKQLKGILEQTLSQGYTQARELRRDLVEIYERI